jgi:hypothetical protein
MGIAELILMKLLAIRLGYQKTIAKSLVMMKLLAIRPSYQKALHSHSAKSPKDGDISRWLTIAKSLVMSTAEGIHTFHENILEVH